MATSSRFVVAAHLLTTLEFHEGEPVNSERLAQSINTNPAVVRRLLSQLSAANLVRTQLGSGGGAMLGRSAKAISLLDVYRAVEDECVFSSHRNPPSEKCIVGKHILPVLERTLEKAEEALEAELAKVSIAEVASSIRRRARA